MLRVPRTGCRQHTDVGLEREVLATARMAASAQRRPLDAFVNDAVARELRALGTTSNGPDGGACRRERSKGAWLRSSIERRCWSVRTRRCARGIRRCSERRRVAEQDLDGQPDGGAPQREAGRGQRGTCGSEGGTCHCRDGGRERDPAPRGRRRAEPEPEPEPEAPASDPSESAEDAEAASEEAGDEEEAGTTVSAAKAAAVHLERGRFANMTVNSSHDV